jgi:restriction system protein
MIELEAPTTWQELQTNVAQILGEAGFDAQVGVEQLMARGQVEIDVLAMDAESVPPILIACECKRWSVRVPQTVVHAFRTVVTDTGANLGLIVSAVGFQSGAFEAAAFSNVRLLNWAQFQEMFCERWFRTYMVPQMKTELDPLVEYTEPINSRNCRRADALPHAKREAFKKLRERHLGLAAALLPYVYSMRGVGDGASAPELPLRPRLSMVAGVGQQLPDDVLDAVALRQLLDALVRSWRAAIAEFDTIFGCRA